MIRINNFQVYCMLILATIPIAFLIVPSLVIELAANNAWLAILASSIPGILLIYIYLYILKKSPQPFPAIIETCLGKVIGKILGISYILVFLSGAAITLSIFLAFIGSSIVPDTPLSVYIFLMLLTSYYALKTGLGNIARISEMLILVGIPLSFIIVLTSLLHTLDIKNLLPLSNINYTSFSYGVFKSIFLMGNLIEILTLAYFSTSREKLPRTLLYVLGTFITLISLTTLVSLMQLGADYADIIAFPTFKVVRSITISDFIQNIDAACIALWISGIFGSISVKWFMACYVTQQVFALKDYRFIAAPTSIYIGVFALILGKNIVELQTIISKVFPILYGFFFFFIPLVLFFILLFKPYPDADLGSGLKNPSA